MNFHIEFKHHNYLPSNTVDGIDSDRYIIPFILTKKNLPPQQDDISTHQIKVEIDGSTVSNESVWKFNETDMAKVIFFHAFSYIKSLITENTLSKDNNLNLDEAHLTKYSIDPNKVPEINQYNFDFKLDEPKKKFGF